MSSINNVIRPLNLSLQIMSYVHWKSADIKTVSPMGHQTFIFLPKTPFYKQISSVDSFFIRDFYQRFFSKKKRHVISKRCNTYFKFSVTKIICVLWKKYSSIYNYLCGISNYILLPKTPFYKQFPRFFSIKGSHVISKSCNTPLKFPLKWGFTYIEKVQTLKLLMGHQTYILLLKTPFYKLRRFSIKKAI